MRKLSTAVTWHCVGRSVIAVPQSFSGNPNVSGQFKTRTMNEKGPSIEVLVRGEKLDGNRFVAEVAKVRNELLHRTSGKLEILRLEKALGDRITLFRVQQIDDAYISHVLLYRGESVIRASLESFEDQYLSAEDRLIEFVNGIRDNPAIAAVDHPGGFCLGGVVVTGDLSEEAGSFSLEDGRGATLGVAIDTYAGDAHVPLLDRVSGPNSLLTIFDVHHRVLRSGERIVAGMKAQEWLGWAQVGERQDAYAFSMETMRLVPGKNAPKIHLSLDTGERLPNGELPGKVMSDDEAVTLWDSVVSSIRPAST